MSCFWIAAWDRLDTKAFIVSPAMLLPLLWDDWVFWLFSASIVLTSTAAAVWPSVREAIDDECRREDELKRRYPILRWADRVALCLWLSAGLILGGVCLLLFVLYRP
jgi:hypothetical protein